MMKTNEKLQEEFEDRAKMVARHISNGAEVGDAEIELLEGYLRSLYMERHYAEDVF